MSNILGIGSSALAAAQVGLSTTGHNIANANTAGYSRQIVVQAAAQSQNYGFGYLGQGTEVESVSRVYNEILTSQAVSSQATYASTQAYSTQLSNIDNLLSDASAGLNPAISDFFNSVSDLAANPSDTPTRQSMLSYAQSLVNRLQSTSSRLNEVRNGINTQLTASVSLVNTYAKQIASLNDSIEKAVSAGGNQPNDLLDQRDQLVAELSKQIKTTVVPQGQGSYNIYVGNGLPLVVGTTTMSLAATRSPTDSSRLEVAYQTNGKTTVLGVGSLPGGLIGGLLQFRSESLDTIQNQIGQIAVVLGETFNTQHEQGVDLNGDQGKDFFFVPDPTVNPNTNNSSGSAVTSQIVNARLITSSDYRLQNNNGTYTITRLSDNKILYNDTTPPDASSVPTSPATSFDGLSFTATGMSPGDDFVISPTRNAATMLTLTISDVRELAIGSTLAPGDNTNGLALAALQSDGTLNNSSTSFSSALGQLVNNVGNKTRELKVTGASEALVFEQATAAVQSESGVNLDEEATNLIRYQQAYQAAGKMMQIASQLFDTLLQLG